MPGHQPAETHFLFPVVEVLCDMQKIMISIDVHEIETLVIKAVCRFDGPGTHQVRFIRCEPGLRFEIKRIHLPLTDVLSIPRIRFPRINSKQRQIRDDLSQ